MGARPPGPSLAGRALLAAVVSLSPACSDEPTQGAGDRAQAGAKPAIERPTLEFAGCLHVAGEVCHLPDSPGPARSLRVWLDVQTETTLRVTIDEAEVAPRERIGSDGGVRLTIDVPVGARSLGIDGVEPRWTAPLRLELVDEARPAFVDEARQTFSGGDARAAVEQLRAALPATSGPERVAGERLLWKLLTLLDDPDARAQMEAAAEYALSVGRTREFAEVASALVFMAIRGRDLATAQRWTDRLAEVDELPEARVWANNYAGELALASGDLSASVRALELAREGAHRLDMLAEFLSASTSLASSLADLGRGDEALALLRDNEALAHDPALECRFRASMLGNAGWGQLLLASSGHEHDPPHPLFVEELELVGEDGLCPNPLSAAHARVNLALAALSEAEYDEAWAWLGELLAAETPAELDAWVAEIAAQLGLETGRWELVPPLVRLPDGDDEPQLRWTAMVRYARTLERVGLHDAAIDGYLAAEDVLEQRLSTVAVDEGRELYLAGRAAGATGLIDLLIRAGRIEEALCRARLARVRSFRTINRAARIAALAPEAKARRQRLLFEYVAAADEVARDARDDWQFSAPERERRERRREERLAGAKASLDEALRLVGADGRSPTCAELPSVAAGELLLAQFPSQSGAWVFAVGPDPAAEIALLSVDDPGAGDVDPTGVSPQAWAEQVLEPLRDRITAARRIRVLPSGSGWSVDFHALPFGDAALLDVAPIVYGLDLPHATTREREPLALVIADPSENLPHAQAEADAVERILADSGWPVRRQRGREATRASLSAGLAEASLFHYAGHGRHGGESGWDAALILHDGELVTVADILALPRVPETIVLSGCETAMVRADTLAGGMNLSRAFVLAGARWVIASDRKVSDEVGQAIGIALYDRSGSVPALDGAEALRAAQLRVRAEHPELDWSAFRVVSQQ